MFTPPLSFCSKFNKNPVSLLLLLSLFQLGVAFAEDLEKTTNSLLSPDATIATKVNAMSSTEITTPSFTLSSDAEVATSTEMTVTFDSIDSQRSTELHVISVKDDVRNFYKILPGDSSIRFSLPESAKAVTLIARYCSETNNRSTAIENKDTEVQNTEKNCSDFSLPFSQVTPLATSFSTRVKNDLSGYLLSWNNFPGYQFNLYQVMPDTSELSLLAEDIQTGEYDFQVESGLIHQILLEFCNTQVCLRVLSELIPLTKQFAGSLVSAKGREVTYKSSIHYDEYQLSRRSTYGSDEYSVVLQTTNFEGIYSDNTAQSNHHYDYQLLGCTTEECEAISELKGHLIGPSLEVENPFIVPVAPSEFSYVSHFMALTFEWQNTGNYDGVVIEELDGVNWQIRATITGNTQTSYSLDYFYSPFSSQWRIRSYFGEVPYASYRPDLRQFSSAEQVEVILFDPLTAELAYNELFSVETLASGQMQISGNFVPGFDQYHLFQKRSTDEDFQNIATFERELSIFRETRPFNERFSASFVDGEVAQYYIQACSSYTQSCADSHIYNFVAQSDNRDVEPVYSTTAPHVELTEAGLEVSVSGADYEAFSNYELYINGRKEDNSAKNYFLIPYTELTPGNSYTLATRQCIRWDNCGEISETTIFEIPSEYPFIPPTSREQVSPSFSFNNDGTADVRFFLSLYAGDLVNKVDEIKVFETNSQGELQEIADIDVRAGALDYTYTGLPVNKHYNFYMQNCNAIGCGTIVLMSSFYLYSPDLPAPRFEVVELQPETASVTMRLLEDREFGTPRYAFASSPITEETDTPFYYIQSAQNNKFSVSGEPGETIYVATRRCIENVCGSLSDNMPITIPIQNAFAIGFEFDAGNYFLQGNNSVELEYLEYFTRGGKSPVYLGEFTSAKQNHLKQGFELEMEFFYQQGCHPLVNQYLEIPVANGRTERMTLFEINAFGSSNCYYGPRNKSGSGSNYAMLLKSVYLNEPLIIQMDESNPWNRLKLVVAADGKLSFYLNDTLLTNTTRALDLSFWQYANTKTDISYDSGLTSLKLDTVSTDTSDGLLLNRTLIEPVQFHPEFAIYNTFDLSVTNRVVFWNSNRSFIDAARIENTEDLIAAVETIKKSLPENNQDDYLMRLCLDNNCPGLQKIPLHNMSFNEITRWLKPYSRFDEEQQKVFFKFYVSDQNKVNASHFNILISPDYGQTFETVATLQTTDIWTPGENSHHSELVEIPEGISVKIYLQACNPINCFITEGSSPYFIPVNPDIDGDGVLNEDDAFPEDPTEWNDTDSDGIGDNSDPDIDNDGVPNQFDQDSTNVSLLTDADSDGLSDSLELALGLNPDEFNTMTEDSDQDGFSDLYEAFAGSDPSEISSVPNSLGYFESFENEDAALMNQTFEFTSTGATHGIYGALKPSNEANGPAFSLDLNLHMNTGYVLFSYHSIDEEAHHAVEVTLNGRNIDFTSQEQYQVMLNSNTSLFFIRIAHGYESVAELDIHISSEATGSIDSLFVPAGESCRFSGLSATKPDFNCDGRADLVVKLPNNKGWMIKDTISNRNTIRNGDYESGVMHGYGDFNGDGVTDMVLRQPATYVWEKYETYSSWEAEDAVLGKHSDDIPVLGDYDGDGKTDLAVRRPTTSMWYIIRSSDSQIERIRFGLQESDIPVPGDYDGDGKTDIAVQRGSNSHWYILNSSDGEIQRIVFEHRPGDIPVPADYDGDGITDIAIRRPGQHEWKIRRSSDGVIQSVVFGRRANDLPVIADYDGDGKADIAVRRLDDHKWYILQSSNNQLRSYTFAKRDDYIPLAAPIMLRLQMERGDFSFFTEN